MNTQGSSSEDQDAPKHYELRIKGLLDDRWAERFSGLTITREANGETCLSGPVADQAALHGLLRNIRDLGVQLVSVRQIGPDTADTPEDRA
jgi:hypothetical protein